MQLHKPQVRLKMPYDSCGDVSGNDRNGELRKVM